MFPYHLDKGDFAPTTWRTVNEPAQVIVDVRTPIMRKRIEAGKAPRTLKNEYDVWEDRPKILASEEVGSAGLWNQSVDLLRDQEQILHCCMAMDNSQVDFVFHKDEGAYMPA